MCFVWFSQSSQHLLIVPSDEDSVHFVWRKKFNFKKKFRLSPGFIFPPNIQTKLYPNAVLPSLPTYYLFHFPLLCLLFPTIYLLHFPTLPFLHITDFRLLLLKLCLHFPKICLHFLALYLLQLASLYLLSRVSLLEGRPGTTGVLAKLKLFVERQPVPANRVNGPGKLWMNTKYNFTGSGQHLEPSSD